MGWVAVSISLRCYWVWVTFVMRRRRLVAVQVNLRSASPAKKLLVVIVVIRSWLITAIVTIVAVTPRHIVPIIRRRLVVSTSRRVGALLFKHRTASSAKLWSVSLQAGHNPVHIGDLRAAEPPNVRRAGYLLFHRSPILLRKCRILNGDAAANRYGKAHENSMRTHAKSF
jgi:hypothetical protein